MAFPTTDGLDLGVIQKKTCRYPMRTKHYEKIAGYLSERIHCIDY